MSEVARLAKVSQSTVSHVINGTRRVDPATEQAVRDAIAATGYFKDDIARSLRSGKTQTIGLAMSAMTNLYFGEVVHAIERDVSNAGYTLLFADTHDDPKHEARVVTELLSRRVDAMIVAPSQTGDSTLDMLSRRAIPTMVIDRIPPTLHVGIDTVGVYNERPTADLDAHLVGHGHRRIAMITSDRRFTTTTERVAGYRLGLEDAQIEWDPELVKVGIEGLETVALRAFDELLELKDPPTAIVMGNNQVSIATITAMQKHGMVPPDDMALVAFDDFPWAGLFSPKLTAMAQPIDDLGGRAVTLLLERIANPDLAIRNERLQPTLVVRESCGCVSPPVRVTKT